MKLLPAFILLKTKWNCERWKNIEPSASSNDQLLIKPERYALALSLKTASSFSKALNLLMTYQIYSPSRMKSKICSENGRISNGVTIIQRILIGPVGFETAVRVIGTFSDDKEIGFTYATLKGHPECGIITFKLSRNSDSLAQLEIESWSRPGHPLLNIFRPFTKLIQKSSNLQALKFFRQQLEE